MMAARRGAPPLASIESLLSFEAKSTPRSEYGLSGLPPGVELAGSDSVLPVESFQVLSGDQQTEEIFKLLSLLSPFAGEVSSQGQYEGDQGLQVVIAGLRPQEQY